MKRCIVEDIQKIVKTVYVEDIQKIAFIAYFWIDGFSPYVAINAKEGNCYELRILLALG